MKKLLFVCVLVFLVTGCHSELSFSEMKAGKVKKEVQSFLESVEQDKGLYLYQADTAFYVFLNGKNPPEGEEAVWFNDFDVKSDGDIVTIDYDEEKLDTSDENEAQKQQRLYKIYRDKEYDVIKSMKNGESKSFDIVSGE
ncbi:hypothetical protein J2S78_000904 [Salibacterium salarium]|uniref:hypothetical protein n=1 Tax=Salibacterium salarium TaxID=284579 RepID=UPI002788E0A3|nr:hypothetical protein [Salibacterium salarium]MDQ0298496.1 hypothetical protein [Salibacterium salarium]